MYALEYVFPCAGNVAARPSHLTLRRVLATSEAKQAHLGVFAYWCGAL